MQLCNGLKVVKVITITKLLILLKLSFSLLPSYKTNLHKVKANRELKAQFVNFDSIVEGYN